MKLPDMLNEEKYNLAGNCVYGLDDPYFRRKVCYDATEMAGIVDEYSNEFLSSDEFIQNVNWPSSMGLPDDDIYEFAYNEYKDIYWAYNVEDDIHFFFVKDSIYENYRDSITVKSIKLIDILEEILFEGDPKTNTGKKPKGLDRLKGKASPYGSGYVPIKNKKQ
jgi:hypothetical protein